MICYSRHCVETIMNLAFDSTKVKWFALYHTNLPHEGFVWVLCDWSFQVMGYLMMDEGIRISKRLSLGMPEAPQDNIQGSSKQLSLRMPPGGIPAFF